MKAAAASMSLALLLAAHADAAQAPPVGGEPVTFQTRDARGDTTALRGLLWAPAGPARGSVVLVHGSGGWSDHREGHHARALRSAGYAALAIDAFGARGIAGTAEDQTRLSSTQMARDAFYARRYLLSRGFSPDRTGIMGFSKGGTAALFAADRNFLPEEGERFKVAVAFYPGCNVQPRSPRPVSAVFMLLGEKDDYTGVARCQEIADGFRKAGGTLSVKVYPDAAHAFDGNPAIGARRHLAAAENYMNCVVHLEEDGHSTHAGKRYAPGDPSLVADLRRHCVTKGASIGTNVAQKEAATRDVIDFLDAAFPD